MTPILAAGFAALIGLSAAARAQQDPPVDPMPTPTHAAPQPQPSTSTNASAAAMSTPKAVGSFKSWAAFTFEDKGRLMCYAQSVPAGTIGTASGRGKAAAMVIQAPDAAAKDQVSIVLGFPPQDGKPVAVRIGRKRFTLKKFAVGRAWADTDSQDQQMVNAMKHSDWMVINAVSAKGEKVQDTYNLSGFGKAYDAALSACK